MVWVKYCSSEFDPLVVNPELEHALFPSLYLYWFDLSQLGVQLCEKYPSAIFSWSIFFISGLDTVLERYSVREQ